MRMTSPTLGMWTDTGMLHMLWLLLCVYSLGRCTLLVAVVAAAAAVAVAAVVVASIIAGAGCRPVLLLLYHSGVLRYISCCVGLLDKVHGK